MGQRTSTETLVGIVTAFWRQRTWSQADLARAVGVQPRAVRKHLEELSLAGWPLHRDEEHPHIYWSVPKGWFPGGVLLRAEELAALIHVLLRVAAGRERSVLLKAALNQAPPLIAEALERVVPPRSSEAEEQWLPAVLDAVAKQQPLRMRYYTASRGALSSRVVSVQRVLVGPPTRLVAFCHDAKALRWFRLDYATQVSAEGAATFQEVEDSDLDRFVGESVDGYRGNNRVSVAFFVRDPEAHWVANNLPEGLVPQTASGGILIEAETAGLLPIARFVVGLGDAAEVRTPELAGLVADLAAGALRSSASGVVRSASAIESIGSAPGPTDGDER